MNRILPCRACDRIRHVNDDGHCRSCCTPLVTDGGQTVDTTGVTVGARVRDREATDGDLLLVVAVTSASADEYRLPESHETVADVNPEYPADDLVMECVYEGGWQMDLAKAKRYAFPVSRLEAVDERTELDRLADEFSRRADSLAAAATELSSEQSQKTLNAKAEGLSIAEAVARERAEEIR